MNIHRNSLKSTLGGMVAGILSLLLSGQTLAGPSTNEVHSLVAQHHLDYDVPIYDATFIGTHNSFSSSAYDYVGTITNQDKTVKKQLEAGYRWLDIDAWQFADSLFASDVDTRLCHGGCAYEDNNLDSFLTEVNDFLNAPGNEGEVIFVSVQDEFHDYWHMFAGNNSAEKGRERFENEVKGNSIWGKIFTNADLPSGVDYYQNDKCVVFPMALTKRDILAAGKQVVLLRWHPDDIDSRCGKNSDSDIFDVTFDIPFKDIAPQSSENNISIKESQRGDISQFYLAQDDRCWICTDSKKSISSSEYIEILERGAHLATLDFGVNQQKHDAVTWSWKEGEPNGYNSGEDCVEQYTSGRWNDKACGTAKRAVACQSELTGEWKVSNASYYFSGATNACTSEFGSHYFFSTPVHAKANRRLRDAAGSAGNIWLNMVRHSEAGSSYVSSSGNIVNVPEEAFTPVDYLVRGQSRKHFYLKDSYSGYVRNDCGGNCSSGDSYADSTTENYEGSNKKLWLIQSYEEGMADFFIGSIDDTVWELADYIMVRSDRQSLEIDNVGETLQIEETPDPHNWPSGSTDGTIISITNGIFSIESRGDNHRPLQVFPRGSCPAPFCTRDQFYPYWD